MRCLVTGISGFVGSHLAERLLADGHQVSGTLLRVSQPGHVAGIAPKLDLVAADIRDPVAVARAVADTGPDVIFHLAGQASVRESLGNPGTAYAVNLMGTVNLLDAVARLRPRTRVVAVTSGEVYGLVTPADLPVREDRPFRPTSPYSASKAGADIAAFQFACSCKLDCVIARPFNHTGPRQSPFFVAPDFAHQVVRIEAGLAPPEIRVGDLSVRRDFLHVLDVIDAYVLLMEKGRAGVAYNIASGRAIEIREILDTLVGMSRVPLRVVSDPSRFRPAEVPEVYGDAGRLRAETGWNPRRSLADALRALLDEVRGTVQHT